LVAYPTTRGLNADLFQLPAEGLAPAQQSHAVAQLEKHLARQSEHFLGYQANQDMPGAKALSFLFAMHANNVGDPFVDGNCTVNTKVMERAVLDYIARLWHAPSPSEAANPESYWGYVVSMGSTEGNLYGMYNARDYLAGKRLWREPAGNLTYIRPLPHAANPNTYRPVAFFGEDTHYSIVKIVRALAIPTFYEIGENEYPGQCPIDGGRWPKEVPSKDGNGGPGTVDIDALTALVEFFAKKGFPPLVVLNYGSTFKGAYDDVEEAGKRLMPILQHYGLATRAVSYDPHDPSKLDTRTGYWIHVDAALAGTYMPFVEMAHAAGQMRERGPNFDFRLPFVHSIVSSAHKWPGSPLPGGVYMTKRKFTIAPPDDPEYIGAPDSTFSGSRNALSPAFLWSYYAGTSYEREIEKIVAAEGRAAYFEGKLQELADTLPGPIWMARSPLSLTIRFRKPNDAIVFKYSLSAETLSVDGEMRPYVHIYVMQSATKDKLDLLLAELRQPGAFELEPLRAAREASGKHAQVERLVHVPLHGRGFR
jgi:histidine decarboxylase